MSMLYKFFGRALLLSLLSQQHQTAEGGRSTKDGAPGHIPSYTCQMPTAIVHSLQWAAAVLGEQYAGRPSETEKREGDQILAAEWGCWKYVV